MKGCLFGTGFLHVKMSGVRGWVEGREGLGGDTHTGQTFAPPTGQGALFMDRGPLLP